MNKPMPRFTATEAKQKFGDLMSTISSGPVTITKSSKDFAVIITAERYKELKRIEDIMNYTEVALKEGLFKKD